MAGPQFFASKHHAAAADPVRAPTTGAEQSEKSQPDSKQSSHAKHLRLPRQQRGEEYPSLRVDPPLLTAYNAAPLCCLRCLFARWQCSSAVVRLISSRRRKLCSDHPKLPQAPCRRHHRRHRQPTLLCSASRMPQKQRRSKGPQARLRNHHEHPSPPCPTGRPARRRCLRHRTRFVSTRNHLVTTFLPVPGSEEARR